MENLSLFVHNSKAFILKNIFLIYIFLYFYTNVSTSVILLFLEDSGCLGYDTVSLSKWLLSFLQFTVFFFRVGQSAKNLSWTA
jgi:hypothetical protein